MQNDLLHSQKLSAKHKVQRDSARTERDSALEQRDSARIERDDFMKQTDNLEKSKILQEQFIATLSHDLRNPISAIKMAIEILREEPDKETLQKMTDLIDRNADQAGELISQLLDTHLIKSGAKLPLEIKSCDIMSVLKKCYQALAPKNQSYIKITSENKKEIFGFWDPQALERVFKNLIGNAIKFGEDNTDIQIHVSQEPDTTSISFQNFGKLISLENQLRIFDSQFRVLQTENRDQKGWGLGLTLVRGIAEAHGGKIEVKSDRSQGTVFTLRLPNDARMVSV